MSEPRERLFRDETGALVERAARLEEENLALRAEVARLQRPSREDGPGVVRDAMRNAVTVRTTANRAAPPMVVLATALFAVFGGLLMTARVAARRPQPAPLRMMSVRAPLTPMSTAAPTFFPSPAGTIAGGGTASGPVDCASPYAVDDLGQKHFKLACLGLVDDHEPGADAISDGRSANDCTTPYWYDTNGVKHYKRRCIHPERDPRPEPAAKPAVREANGHP